MPPDHAEDVLAPKTFKATDVTLVVGVRLHRLNRWVADRLRLLAGWYDPMPCVIIVDFGSSGAFRSELAELCSHAGYELLRVEDEGVFSLARARNIGFSASRTDLVFFSDADCLGEPDLVARLARHATFLDLDSCFDQIINLPVHHLSQSTTDSIITGFDLGKALAASPNAGRGVTSTFVAPYSNIFLCHRHFFDLVGGFDESFRGHGSEDFEFLLRFALISRQFPLPADPQEDSFGPLTPEYFEARPYQGFRRLFEAMAFSSEVAGLRVAHLHHPKPKESDWYAEHDTGRRRFNQALRQTLNNHQFVLDKDWLPREKTACVPIVHSRHFRFLLPLRLAGYRLIPMRPQKDDLERFVTDIEAGKFDVVVAFRPTLRAHTSMRPLLQAAESAGVRRLLVEPGPLPFSYDYGRAERSKKPSADDRRRAGAYLDQWNPQEVGQVTASVTEKRLESMGGRGAILVPLNGTERSDEALARLVEEVAMAHPGVSFIVRPSPLRPIRPRIAGANVAVCRWDEHLATLLDHCDAVICDHSTLGLYAAMAGMMTVTIGDPAWIEAVHAADSLQAAVCLVQAHISPRDPIDVVAQLLAEHSFFHGTPVLESPANQLVFDLCDPFFGQLVVDEVRFETRRARLDCPVARTSYTSARVGTQIRPKTRVSKPASPPITQNPPKPPNLASILSDARQVAKRWWNERRTQ